MKNLLSGIAGLFSAIGNSFSGSMSSAPPSLVKKSFQILLVLVAVFSGIAGYKYYSFRKEQNHLEEEMAAGPRVRWAKVTKGVGEHRVVVIGETRPFESATIYAKVSGYLKKVWVDKGDVVKEGQVLAVIESPETDEAFLAAEADYKNKSAILARMKTLLAKKLVSQQEFDQAKADADVSSAKLRSQQTLKGYETLKAPFAGTVTARYADVGALVQNATSSETSSLPIVMVSQIKKLRIDVFIDQREAPYIQKDAPVMITIPERPGFKLEGRVARISGELDPRTKMLLTEIDISNEDLSLVAGSFVQVSLLVKSPPYLQVPVESLTQKGEKPVLTVITPENTLAYRAVELASNDGKNLSVISGISEGDRVALNLGSSLPEGNKVRPIEEVATPPPAAPTAAPTPAATPTPSAAPTPPAKSADNTPGGK